ncbi:MAG: sigma-70 family RNA polymerase sigma factor [Candidatus Poribacteria bacterium]|nr:sigma-70 family RNA polymerase sigma factor [Candidatus Poribacteria bacterium]
MKNKDAELIQRTLAGDNNAFSELVKKYQKQVHALAWRKVGDFHTAEDITQDTFLKAYQRLHTLKEPQRFAGWLYVIATRRCLAWFRKKRLQKQALENVGTPATNKDAYSRHVAEEQAKTVDKEQQEVVKKLLETLQESDRTVITLHYFGEMTCEEMSEFLGVSANTIKSRLRRARNRLKKEEPMIREAIGNFQISPNLTENIMQEINRLKPATPSASKPLLPWVIGAASTVLIVLMLGIGSQYLANFQQPYSLDAQSERAIELVDAPVVQNVDAKPDVRNQLGKLSAIDGRDNGDGEKANQVLGDKVDYTLWNLPDGAKQRLGKGILNDMQLSPDGTHLAIASSIGVWLYDINTGAETALFTKDLDSVKLVAFSPDGKIVVSADRDNIIRSWDVESGKQLLAFKTPRKTYSTQFKLGNTFENLLRNKPSGNELFSLQFLSDEKTLVGTTWDRTVWFWDMTTGKKLKTFNPKFPKIKIKDRIRERALAAFVDHIGNVVYAFGNKDGTISVQDGNTHRHLSKLIARLDDSWMYKDDGTPFPIQYQLAPQKQPRSVLDSLPTSWKAEADMPPMRWITKLEFSPDGKMLVSKSDYRLLKGGGWSGRPVSTEVWDVDKSEQLAALPSNVNVKFSKDGKTLALIGEHGCSIWNVASRSEIITLPKETDIRFSENGKTFAIIDNRSYAIWDIATRSEIAVLDLAPEQFEDFPEHFVLSEDGKTLVTTSTRGTVDVWDTQNSTQLCSLTKDYSKPTRALVFSHDGETLATSDRMGNIQLWDPNSGKKQKVIKTGNKSIDGLAFYADSTTLTSVRYDSLKQWDITTGKQVDAYTIPRSRSDGNGRSIGKGTGFGIDALAFTPNSEKLIIRGSSSSGTYKIWDIKTGSHPHLLSEVVYQRGIVAISSDGNLVATSNNNFKDSVVSLWNANTGNQLVTFNISKPKNWISNLSKNFIGNNNVYALAFAPDGETLAVGNRYREVELWHISSRQRIKTLKKHKHAVCKLIFSSDGTILASGDAGGKIHLWDFPTCQHITTFKLPSGSVDELVFAPDGKILASVGSSGWGYKQDGTILLWDVPSK